MTNISRSALYEAIKEGSLIARKRGARTVITAADGLAWLEGLPVMCSPASEAMNDEIGG